MQKLLTFFSKNISVYAIFNNQSFNDTLTNDIVSFEQLDHGFGFLIGKFHQMFYRVICHPYEWLGIIISCLILINFVIIHSPPSLHAHRA